MIIATRRIGLNLMYKKTPAKKRVFFDYLVRRRDPKNFIDPLYLLRLSPLLHVRLLFLYPILYPKQNFKLFG